MLSANLAQHSKEKGNYLTKKLQERQQEVSIIRNIRNMGLMIGIELKTRVKPYLEMLLENGLIAMPAGKTVLRLLPPLTIEYEDIDRAVNIIISTLNSDVQSKNDNQDD